MKQTDKQTKVYTDKTFQIMYDSFFCFRKQHLVVFDMRLLSEPYQKCSQQFVLFSVFTYVSPKSTTPERSSFLARLQPSVTNALQRTVQ